MRIGDDYLNTVTFLCVEEQLDDGVFRPVPRATAFLVLVTEAGLNYYYVVTARHCIEEAGRDHLYVRVNRADEGYEDIPSNRADWYTHDAADVAAIPFAVRDLASLRVSLVPLFQFVDGDYRFRGRQSVFEQTLATINGLSVEPGHAVFFLGLFIQHAGKARNLPIARFGAISRMPIEPVAIRRQSGATERVSGYLAECRSWGGHSGSPAFWVSPDSIQGIEMPHPSGQGTMMAFRDLGVTGFLGLVSAHFNIATPATGYGDVITDINAGIAVITPAEAVRELLMREDLAEERRRKAIKATGDEPAATYDIAGQSKASKGNDAPVE